VNEYIDALPAHIQPLFINVRETILTAEPSLNEAIKWCDCLTYERGRNIIQTVVGKDKISLIFFDGIDLDDPAGLLEGEGKRVRTMRVTSKTFDKHALRSYVKQAVRLVNESRTPMETTTPAQSRRKRHRANRRLHDEVAPTSPGCAFRRTAAAVEGSCR
jgi:hypothetical protein